MPSSPAMRTTCVTALIGFCLLWAAAVSAHPVPFSYLDLHLRGGGIEGSLIVHTFDLAHELKIDPPERLLDPSFVADRSTDDRGPDRTSGAPER